MIIFTDRAYRLLPIVLIIIGPITSMTVCSVGLEL